MCNYCIFRQMLNMFSKDWQGAGCRMTIMPSRPTGGLDVWLHPTDVQIPRNPNLDGEEGKYHKLYFLDLPAQCSCVGVN